MSTETRTVWTICETTGRTVQCGDRFELRADWGNSTETHGTEEEAEENYRVVLDELPYAWKRENDCSNGRFRMKGGLVAAKLEREVREWDEDAEEWVWVDGEVLSVDVWDGADGVWVEF